MFLSTDPNITIQQPANWDRFLGHDKRWKEGGPGTIGYSEAGEFRDVLLVPPLSNITVSRNFVHKHAPEADINSMMFYTSSLRNYFDEWTVWMNSGGDATWNSASIFISVCDHELRVDFWIDLCSCYTSVFPFIRYCNSRTHSLDAHNFFKNLLTPYLSHRQLWGEIVNFYLLAKPTLVSNKMFCLNMHYIIAWSTCDAIYSFCYTWLAVPQR